MRSMRQRLAAVTLLSGLTTLGIGLAAGPASAAQISDCSKYLGDAQSGSLHLTSTPAAGSSVAAGSSISLTASWNEADFGETDRMFTCGTVDGVLNAAMSAIDFGVNNDGSATMSTTIPSSVPVGSHVCVLSALKGGLANAGQGEMVSETLCYTSAAVATTTTTAAPTTTTTTTVAPRVVEPTVDPVNTEAGTTAGPAVEPAPAVGGEVAVAPAPLPVLPRTGSGIDVLAGFGGVALALGGLTRFMARRRRPSEG
jgi:hypothetical protein